MVSRRRGRSADADQRSSGLAALTDCDPVRFVYVVGARHEGPNLGSGPPCCRETVILLSLLRLEPDVLQHLRDLSTEDLVVAGAGDHLYRAKDLGIDGLCLP